MKHAIIYSSPTCSYCYAAKSLLAKEGYSYTEYNVRQDPNRLTEMLQLSNARTVPQIVIDDKHIGGYSDLVEYFARLKSGAE